MRLVIILIFTSLSFLLVGGGHEYMSFNSGPPPDTVAPPPPPGGANPLSGPGSACVGETSSFQIDVPIACICQWSVNGIVQPGDSSTLVMTWSEAGPMEVSVVFICSGGQVSDPETITCAVAGIPEPQPISGNNSVCEYTYHTYSTVVGPYDSCQWTVNGLIQPGYDPSITYSFGEAGLYQFEVIAFNPCGTSDPQTLEVIAQGTAPGTPSPIQGTESSCTGATDIYTTTVGPGESCEWLVDGVLQPSISNTMHITWTEWGDHLVEVRAVSDCGTGNPAIKNVLVLYAPIVDLGNDTTILLGQSLILDAGNPGSEYLWSTGETTRTITVSLSGSYSVMVSNFCGTDSDLIEVSVIVGIFEPSAQDDCFTVFVQNRQVSFPGLPAGTAEVQIIDLSGRVVFMGLPTGGIIIDHPGVYLVRVISKETSCCKKVFIP